MVKAAHASGKVLMKYYGKNLQIREKMGAGLVTQADLEAEIAAVKVLRKAAPHFAFLTEENTTQAAGPAGSHSEGKWIIDPLDGTTNFVHGFPMFCVSIAAEIEEELQIGVIYQPCLDETYVAVQGQGAVCHSKGKKARLRVSSTNQLHDSLLTTGFTYRKEKWLHEEMEAFERLSAVARAVRRPGSAALDLAYTARGVFDGFWERRLSPWDVAAGMVLVREAGGMVSDFQHQNYKLEGREILASNGVLHDELLKAINPEICKV